jgi:dTMP kinase
MFIVFEGIDGSGKTTVSNRVAKALRKRGIGVTHVREDGEFALPVLRRMREFGKDTRNLELVPLAEVLLYLARDAQLAAEAIAPALATSEVVFADRYLYSYEVLGCDGRGLDRGRVRQLIDAVSGGLWPDLVVLCDVDPHVARGRRKVRKLSRDRSAEPVDGSGGSRKGLGGVGVQHRLRDGYLALARSQPSRWLVVENTYSDLDAVVRWLTETIAERCAGAPAVGRPSFGSTDDPLAGVRPHTCEAAAAVFYQFIERRAEKEPAVAAYFLSGMADERAYRWRHELKAVAADVVAYSIRGLADETAWRLRDELIDVAPFQVARSLSGDELDPERTHAMRLRLLADEPGAVLASTAGDCSARAWAVRRQLADGLLPAVVSSLRGDDSPEAWALRERLAAASEAGSDPAVARALAQSVQGLASERAWAIRRTLFEQVPTSVLASLAGVYDVESWRWRERWAARAGKIVVRTFDGVDDERAWRIRRDCAATVKEAIDSIVGLDSAAAWELRDSCADIWPSTVLKSVLPLAHGERAQRLACRLLERHPTNISLHKHAARMAGLLEARQKRQAAP